MLYMVKHLPCAFWYIVDNIYCKYLTKLGLLLLLMWPVIGKAADGIEFDRLKVLPVFSVEMIHTDNYFTSEDDEKSELITTLSPEFNFYFALLPENEISFEYHGAFKVYRENNRYDNNSQFAELAWSLRKPLGSKLKIGGGIEDSAIQPYSENESEKEYVITKAFLDSEVRAGGITGFDFGYEFIQRSFEESVNERDEFSRHRARIGVVYDKYALTSLVSRYIYEIQDNNDLADLSSDMHTHTLLAGVRRKQTARLSGSFMGGYTWTEVDDFENFSGIAINADFAYELSEISRLVFSMNRQVIKSTIAERETNIYYNSTRCSVNLSVRRWAKFEIGGSFLIRNNAYEGAREEGGNRSDDLYGITLRSNYDATTMLMVSAEYRYRNNDSNKETFSYEENSGLLLLTLAI